MKDVTDDMILWKTKGTELYQQLAQDCLEELKETEPLSEMPPVWEIPNGDFKSWRRQN